MRTTRVTLACLLFFSVFFMYCRQESKVMPKEIDSDVIRKIASAGFSTNSVVDVDSGYIVEGDIFLRKDLLDIKPNSPILRIAESEQYRTNILVTGLPKVITIAVTGFPTTVFTTATDEAIARYNALGLRLTFQRVSSGANITISAFSVAPDPTTGQIVLGSSGFPPGGGNPYSSIQLNVHPAAYGSNPDMLHLASVIQHEIGHCIGFRHTDYFNRSYSCGFVGPGNNEGASTVGAVHIPGTPTAEDPNSFMLACIMSGQNRSFNANDIIALNSVYGNCSRADQKFINGVCETAEIELVHVEEAPRGYVCSYDYVWSDGSSAPYRTLRTLNGCPSTP